MNELAMNVMFYVGMVAIGFISGSLITKILLKEEIKYDFQNPPRKVLRQAERFARKNGYDQKNAEKLVGSMSVILLGNNPYDNKRKSKSRYEPEFEEIEMSLEDLINLFSE